MKNKLLQAYKQAPWRIQAQWIGLILLGLVMVAAIAGIYLSASAKASTFGREIQRLDSEIETTTREIADLSTHLATISSAEVMAERVKALKMILRDPQASIYLEVPGYTPRSVVNLAPSSSADFIKTDLLQPAYTTSLMEWFIQNVWLSADTSTEVAP